VLYNDGENGRFTINRISDASTLFYVSLHIRRGSSCTNLGELHKDIWGMIRESLDAEISEHSKSGRTKTRRAL
jgi:hypothetical protein